MISFPLLYSNNTRSYCTRVYYLTKELLLLFTTNTDLAVCCLILLKIILVPLLIKIIRVKYVLGINKFKI